jgi:hypothetical protein
VGIVLGKMMDRFGANVIDWHGRVVIDGGGSRSLVLVGPGWIGINRGESWKQRVRDVQALVSAGFSVAWAGHPESRPRGVVPLPFTMPMMLPALASRSAVTLCVDYRSDVDGYHSDRTWVALGMGACVVRRWSPGLPELPCFEYHDHDELIDTVRRLAADLPRRQQTGERARAFVMEGHKYQDRVTELLRHDHNRSTRTVVDVHSGGA